MPRSVPDILLLLGAVNVLCCGPSKRRALGGSLNPQLGGAFPARPISTTPLPLIKTRRGLAGRAAASLPAVCGEGVGLQRQSQC